MGIDIEMLEAFRKRLEGTVDICNCDEVDEEWKGDDHLCQRAQGLSICFYPDIISNETVVLNVKEL